MKSYVLVRPDGWVQQHLQSPTPLPDEIGGMRVMEWAGDPSARLRLVDGSLQVVDEAAPITELEARARRSQLFAATDWTQVVDSPLSEYARALWAEYRQALRDLPSRPGWPSAVAWPTPPA